MRVTTKAFAGLVLAGALLAPRAFALTGIRVIPGDSRSTTISGAADTDQYLFAGVEGGRLSVTVRGTTGGFQPSLTLINEMGATVVLGGAYSAGGGSATLTDFQLSETGTFILQVAGTGTLPGAYSLLVGGSRLPSSQGTASIPAGDAADFSFTGVTGGAVTFSVVRVSGSFAQEPFLLDVSMDPLPGTATPIRFVRAVWTGRNVPLGDGASGTYTLRVPGPATGDPAVVRVRIRPLFASHPATRIRVPTEEPVAFTAAPSIVLPGESVTLTGENFSNLARVFLSQISFPDVEVTVTEVSADGTRLVFQVPLDASGLYSIQVANPEGQGATLTGAVSVDSGDPGSAGVDPTTGPATSSTPITITGVGFIPGMTVTLDDGVSPIGLAVNYIDSNTVTVTMPPHAAGPVDLVLQNPGADPVRRSQAFTYTDPQQSRFFGDATEGAIPNYATETQSQDALAGSRGSIVDLNGDGLNDIVMQSAILRPAGASLRILHQITPGVFQDDTRASIPDRFGGFSSAIDLGEGPGVAVGDLDGDSFPDIVCTGSYVPKSNSQGTREYEIDREEDGGSSGFTDKAGKAGDFDIFWNDHYSGSRVFKNDGEGNFFSSPFTNSGVRRIPLVGFYTTYGAQQNAADQSFLATKEEYTLISGYIRHRFRGDPGFVVDGGITLVRPPISPYWPNPGYYSVGYSQYANYGNWEPPNLQGYNYPSAAPVGGERFQGDAVAIGDMDGDGTNDIVVSSLGLIFETRALTFQRQDFAESTYLASFQRPSTRILLNQNLGGASGTFVDAPNPLIDPSLFAFPDTGYGDACQGGDIAIGDLNGDGLNDLVITADRRFILDKNRVLPSAVTVKEYRSGTRIFLNKPAPGSGPPVSSGEFNDATRSSLPVVDDNTPSGGSTISLDFFGASRVVLGDIDRDGDPDMVLSCPTGKTVRGGERPFTRVFLNRNDPDGNPTGIFDDVTDIAMPPVPDTGDRYFDPTDTVMTDFDFEGEEKWQANGIALHDINRDGYPDLILTTKGTAIPTGKAGTRVLINDKSGGFNEAPPDTYIPSPDPTHQWQGDIVLTGDLNGDGVADLLIGDDSDPPPEDATRVFFHN